MTMESNRNKRVGHMVESTKEWSTQVVIGLTHCVYYSFFIAKLLSVLIWDKCIFCQTRCLEYFCLICIPTVIVFEKCWQHFIDFDEIDVCRNLLTQYLTFFALKVIRLDCKRKKNNVLSRTTVRQYHERFERFSWAIDSIRIRLDHLQKIVANKQNYSSRTLSCHWHYINRRTTSIL